MQQIEAKPDPKATIRDLSDREFRAWKHHPVSLVVRRFLEDRADFLWDELKGRFLTGTLKLTDETEIRGRIVEIYDFLGLEWPQIVGFYGLEEAEKPQENV